MRRLRLEEGESWSGRQAGRAAEAIGDANISARVRRDISRQIKNEVTRELQRIAGCVPQVRRHQDEQKQRRAASDVFPTHTLEG